jgi:hypothetical protein
VCNAAEGEPATFKNRLLLRTNPNQALEGWPSPPTRAAPNAYIGLKETFTSEIQALTRGALGRCAMRTCWGDVAVELVAAAELVLDGWAADPTVALFGVTAWDGASKIALVAHWPNRYGGLAGRPRLRTESTGSGER